MTSFLTKKEGDTRLRFLRLLGGMRVGGQCGISGTKGHRQGLSTYQIHIFLIDVLELMGHAISILLLMGCNKSQEPSGELRL